MPTVEPWLPPAWPDLAQLAMAAADDEGLAELRAWPRAEKGGITFGSLPTFLAWRGRIGEAWHLVLLQAREVGALVPGARTAPMPIGWLEALDLAALARPLARHPDFPGGVSVHVVHLPGGPSYRARTFGMAAPEVIEAVLRRVSPRQVWDRSE